MRPNFYQLLNVSKTATPAEITKAYRSVTCICHPDMSYVWIKPEDLEFLHEVYNIIKEGYQVLSNPDSRKKYDEDLVKSAVESNSPASQEAIKAFQKKWDRIKKEHAEYLQRREQPDVSLKHVKEILLEWKERSTKQAEQIVALQRQVLEAQSQKERLEHELLHSNTYVQTLQAQFLQQQQYYESRLKQQDSAFMAMQGVTTMVSQKLSQNTALITGLQFENYQLREAMLKKNQEEHKRLLEHPPVYYAPFFSSVVDQGEQPLKKIKQPIPEAPPRVMMIAMKLTTVIHVYDNTFKTDKPEWCGVRLKFCDRQSAVTFSQEFAERFRLAMIDLPFREPNLLRISYKMETALSQACLKNPERMGEFLLGEFRNYIELTGVPTERENEGPSIPLEPKRR